MNKDKVYSWNRNVSHHRIALTRFAVFSFIAAFVAMMGSNLSMATIYDGTRRFVTVTMVIGFLAFLFVFCVMFMFMTVMYRWVCDLDARRDLPKEKTPPTPPEKGVDLTMYQMKNGQWHLVDPSRVGGSKVSTVVDTSRKL